MAPRKSPLRFKLSIWAKALRGAFSEENLQSASRRPLGVERPTSLPPWTIQTLRARLQVSLAVTKEGPKSVMGTERATCHSGAGGRTAATGLGVAAFFARLGA